MKQTNKITYIANAGVMIDLQGKKILIDGLCNPKLPIYKNTPDDIKKRIIQGRSPFNNIDVILFTHHHTDHFDPISTAEFIKYNPNTPVVSTKEVISRIKNIEESTLLELDPALGSTEKISVQGIKISAIPMLHEGKEYINVKNLAYQIEVEGTRILHVGDAKSVKENFDCLDNEIDILIAPFPFVGLPSARQVIEKYINPKKIAAVHLPYQELDSFGWIEGTKKSLGRVSDNFVETVFFEEIGDNLEI